MLNPEHQQILDNFAKYIKEIQSIVDFFENNDSGLVVAHERTSEEIKVAMAENKLQDGLNEVRALEKSVRGTPNHYIGVTAFVDAIADTAERAETYRRVWIPELLQHLYKHFGIDPHKLELARRALLEEQRNINLQHYGKI